MLLAAGLRLHGLARHGIWLDEAYSIAVARQDLAAIAPSLADESGPPLYYWILHLWIALCGEGEIAVRGLSVLFGVLLVPATALLARRLAPERAAILAGWLVAATPIAVQFSQETRMYTLLPLLAALVMERLLAYLERGGRWALAAHSLLMAAAFYAHNWGLLLLPAAAAAVAIHPKTRWRGWGVAALLSLLLYAPWIPALRAQAGALSYIFIGMVQKIPAWQLPFRSLALFACGVGSIGPEARGLLPRPVGVLAAVAWVAFAVAALRDPTRRRSGLAVLLMGAIPLVEAALYSGLVRPIYLLGRYEIMVLPAWLALAAAGAESLLRRSGARPIAAAGLQTAWVVGLAAVSFSYTAAVQRRFPEQEMAARLAPELRPGDRVVFTGLYRAAMEYYLRRAGAVYTAASFPPDAGQHLGWFYDSLYDPSDPVLREAAREACPRAGGRTWVVATGTNTCRLLLEELAKCSRGSAPFSGLGPPAGSLLLAEPDAPAEPRVVP
jgi:4-amino-4-deoxy-L-arabinose transferase-like glycosyltransferase